MRTSTVWVAGILVTISLATPHAWGSIVARLHAASQMQQASASPGTQEAAAARGEQSTRTTRSGKSQKLADRLPAGPPQNPPSKSSRRTPEPRTVDAVPDLELVAPLDAPSLTPPSEDDLLAIPPTSTGRTDRSGQRRAGGATDRSAGRATAGSTARHPVAEFTEPGRRARAVAGRDRRIGARGERQFGEGASRGTAQRAGAARQTASELTRPRRPRSR